MRIPIPPPTERPTSGSHLSELRKRRVSGHVVDSDIDLRCERQGLMTAPVSSGRRRVTANFQGIEYQKTGSAVINNVIQRGDLNVPVVSVINVDPTWGSHNVQTHVDKSVINGAQRGA